MQPHGLSSLLGFAEAWCRQVVCLSRRTGTRVFLRQSRGAEVLRLCRKAFCRVTLAQTQGPRYTRRLCTLVAAGASWRPSLDRNPCFTRGFLLPGPGQPSPWVCRKTHSLFICKPRALILPKFSNIFYFLLVKGQLEYISSEFSSN